MGKIMQMYQPLLWICQVINKINQLLMRAKIVVVLLQNNYKSLNCQHKLVRQIVNINNNYMSTK